MSLHVVFAGNLDRDSLKMTDAEDSATPTNPPTPDLALSPGGHAHAVLRHPEKTTMMSPVSDTNPLINTEVAIEKGIDGWPKDPVVLEELLRQADAELRERAKGSVIKAPSLEETELTVLTAQLEKRRLAHKLDLDLADEQVKHKFRVEVVKIAQKELKQKRARLQVLKTRFQGVVKANTSKVEHSSRKAEQERKDIEAKESEITQLRMVEQALLEFKEEREELAKSNAKFLVYLESVSDQPSSGFVSPHAIISRFSSLSTTKLVLETRQREAEEREKSLESEIAELKVQAEQRMGRSDLDLLGQEVEKTVGETKKLQGEVDELLAKHGPKMEKVAETQRQVSALYNLIQTRDPGLLATTDTTSTKPTSPTPSQQPPSKTATALSNLDSILDRVRDLDQLLELYREFQKSGSGNEKMARRQSRPATARSVSTPKASSKRK